MQLMQSLKKLKTKIKSKPNTPTNAPLKGRNITTRGLGPAFLYLLLVVKIQ
jgi:hypothetical protein